MALHRGPSRTSRLRCHLPRSSGGCSLPKPVSTWPRSSRGAEPSAADWQRLASAGARLYRAPPHSDSSARTVTSIRAKCRDLARRRGLHLFVVDYLQLLEAAGRRENRQQEIAPISHSLSLKALAQGNWPFPSSPCHSSTGAAEHQGRPAPLYLVGWLWCVSVGAGCWPRRAGLCLPVREMAWGVLPPAVVGCLRLLRGTCVDRGLVRRCGWGVGALE